jgi:hypothetical protein
MAKNVNKIYSWKKIEYFFSSKIAIYLSLMPKKKPSALKREHPALQNIKFLKKFLFSWVIFALLDPDSESGYGPTDPTESRNRNTAIQY